MTERILQCCYTNASQEIGGTISSGWQPVAVSENIPAEAYNACVSFQNANSTIQNAMFDEHGNVLNLFEISGDGSYVYIMRTQYGLLDRLGRANMFSHAFIFSWKDKDVLSDPNYILSIDSRNFKSCESDAASIPVSLQRVQGIDISTAMQMSNLNEERYLKLIQCVYTQMTEKKITEPLFIQYDGTESQMRALLFCIYYGLPHYLRKTLCIASNTANNDLSKNVIFSENAESKLFFFVPTSGANNVLSGRTERKITRYGFVDYAARNIATINAPDYFSKLEKTAVELGDSTASNELILKIAHQLMQNSNVEIYSDTDLDGILSDALRSKSSNSALMEKYIAAMLSETRKRKLFLTDESEANLADRLASPITLDLENAGEQYNIYRFSTLSAPEAAKKLGYMSPDVFHRYAKKLAEIDNGLEILDLYYSTYVLSSDDVSWLKLKQLWNETSYMTYKPKTDDKIGELAWALYSETVKVPGLAIKTYEEYIALMKRMLQADKIEDCCNAAKEEYWESINFENLSLAAGAEYKFMQIRSHRCNMLLELFLLLYNLSKQNGEEFLSAVQTYFKRYYLELTEKDKENIFTQIEKAISDRYSGHDSMLIEWVHVSSTVDAPELLKEIVNIRYLLYRCQYAEMVECFLQISEVCMTWAKNSKTIMNGISNIIIDFCEKHDSELHYVPLDVWLSIGGVKFTNTFTIFDKIKPAVLNAESFYVIQESKLISKRKYIRDAEDYIQCRGEEAKTIKKWLAELKQVTKRRRADERYLASDSPASSSIVDKGLSLFSKLTQGSDESSNSTNSGSDGQDKKGKIRGFFGRK
ncbi:hypothetical protein B5E64_02445 [Drancourtella sp. An12]|uniref:GAP1-N2 domain-containing protein n=1 Tax=Drancourtella sp. An12 TaxID=1965548 RepID=UPI000B37AD77|nr:hypothetical protein [Drancourtella sp. An12]OUQ46899.1 hypothetical protein B5E64_02445 [Drancourtella sp. An12]